MEKGMTGVLALTLLQSQSLKEVHSLESLLNLNQPTLPKNYSHEASKSCVFQGTVPDHTSGHGADVPLAQHNVTLQDTPFTLSTIKTTENIANVKLKSSETATVPISAASPLVVLRSQGLTAFENNSENRRDSKPPEKSNEGPMSREQRVKVLQIFGSCSDCRQKRVACQPAHHNITWEDLDRWWQFREDSNSRFATEKESAPAAAGHSEQQSYAPFQEGTVADSGYVSACAPRPHRESKLHEELIDRGTMTQPEEYDRAAGDQNTVYTSLALPHGSDYITDLCNDIHVRLKHELLENTKDQARIELPKCLPDLIKALAIRIGLDRSNPASAYVMHFLHTHNK